MNSLNEMLNISARCRSEINKICQPLIVHFGVSNFTYSKMKNDGNFYCLASNVDWMNYYFAESLYLKQPHWRHPKNFQSSISLPKNILNEEYQSINRHAGEKFNVNFCVVIFNQVADGMEFIGLDVNTSSQLHDVLILNELPLIRKFISKFVDDNQSLLSTLDDHQIDFKPLIGNKFESVDIPVVASFTQRKQFLNEIGIEVPDSLSDRDNEMLKQLLHGNTAPQIAENLHLSCRTVEHYIERLKNKLNCFSKWDLIKKARELEVIGYF